MTDFEFRILRDFLEHYFGQDVLLLGYLMMLVVARLHQCQSVG